MGRTGSNLSLPRSAAPAFCGQVEWAIPSLRAALLLTATVGSDGVPFQDGPAPLHTPVDTAARLFRRAFRFRLRPFEFGGLIAELRGPLEVTLGDGRLFL